MSPSHIRVPVLRPRNPIAAPARQRKAGTHTRGRGALRQAGGRALRRELTELHPPPGH